MATLFLVGELAAYHSGYYWGVFDSFLVTLCNIIGQYHQVGQSADSIVPLPVIRIQL